MFILYENTDKELKLFCVPPSYVQDIDNKMSIFPEYPWDNHIKLDDDHPIITNQFGPISVGDWGDSETVIRSPTSSDLNSEMLAIAINRVQFKSMLALMGKTTDDVLAAIDAVITDPTQNTIAKIKVTDSDRYSRANSLFTLLGPSLSITDDQIDAAWQQAVLI